MSKQAVIQLTTDFLVILIISVVVFSMGLYIAFNVLDLGNTQIEYFEEESKKVVNEALISGKKFAVGLNDVKVKRGNLVTFYLGIRNDDCNVHSGSGEFTIKVIWTGSAVSPDGVEISYVGDVDPNKWTVNTKTVIISMNDKRDDITIPINPATGTTIGKYIFNAEAYCGTNSYGTLQKIYVNVI